MPPAHDAPRRSPAGKAAPDHRAPPTVPPAAVAPDRDRSPPTPHPATRSGEPPPRHLTRCGSPAWMPTPPKPRRNPRPFAEPSRPASRVSHQPRPEPRARVAAGPAMGAGVSLAAPKPGLETEYAAEFMPGLQRAAAGVEAGRAGLGSVVVAGAVIANALVTSGCRRSGVMRRARSSSRSGRTRVAASGSIGRAAICCGGSTSCSGRYVGAWLSSGATSSSTA